MNSVIGWVFGCAFVAVTAVSVKRRLWIPAGIYALLAIGTVVFLSQGGELDLLLNALTVILCMLMPGIFLWTARGKQFAQESGISVSSERALGAILIVCAIIATVALVLSALQPTPPLGKRTLSFAKLMICGE